MRGISWNSKTTALAVLLIIGLITVLMAPGLKKLEMKNNYESDLPEKDDIISQNKHFEDIFGKRDELIVVICSADILNPRTLRKIHDITERIKEIPGVLPYDTWSLSTIDYVGFSRGTLKAGPLMRNIPETESEINALREEINDDVTIYGRIVSSDFTRALIIAHLDENYKQSAVADEAERIIGGCQGPESIYLLGDPIIGEEVDRAIEEDIKRLFPLALLLMLALFFLFFRTITGVILPAGVIMLSVVWTMGLSGYIGYPLTVVSSAIPVLLVAVASSYGIHVIHNYQYFLNRECSVKTALSKAVESIRKPVIITGVTSALGSVTLMVFQVSSIREFGVLTAAGFFFAMVLALTLVPSVLHLRKEKNRIGKGCQDEEGRISGKLLNLIKAVPLSYKKTVFVVYAALVIISIFGMLRLRVGMDPVNFFPEDFPFARNIRDFDEHFSGARKMYIMVESTDETVKSPRILEDILAFQREAEKLETVGDSFSFADVIKRTNLVLHENNRRYDSIPETEGAVAQAALLYSTIGEPEKFESIVSHDFLKTKITLDVRTSDVEAHSRLYRILKKKAELIFGRDVRVVFGGLMMIWIAQIRYIVIGKLLNIFLSLILLVIIATVIFRSLKLGALAILPVSMALLLNFGIMGFTGVRLNMATAIITAMGAGIGVDFAVHYLFRIRDNLMNGLQFREAVNSTVESSGKAIVVDMFSNVTGFFFFALSPFEPVRQFGLLICMTMISSAVGALILIPACMSVMSEYREHGQKKVMKAGEYFELVH